MPRIRLRALPMAHRLTAFIAAASLAGCISTSTQNTNDIQARMENDEKESKETDCKNAPFKPRSFPLQIINITVRRASPDPYNTIVGDVFSKCIEGSIDDHLICGVSGRKNNAGYIDNTSTFFGHYFMKSSDFRIVATGAKALALCRENGL